MKQPRLGSRGLRNIITAGFAATLLILLSHCSLTAAAVDGALEIAIRPGSQAAGLNVRSPVCPGDLFDFRTCEGVVVGSADLGLFQVQLPTTFGDGNQSWRTDGKAWSYCWPYARGVTVQFTVEPDDDSLKLSYTLRNTGSNALDAVQLHTCIPTTEAPGFFPPPTPGKPQANWSELYKRLHVWSGDRCFTFADTQLSASEPHLSLMRQGAVPVRWGWWVNGRETFDLPLIALASRDGRKTVALAFEQAVWASANTGDDRACFHLFPWFGRIESGGSATVRGRLYVVRGGPPEVLSRFRKDFPQVAMPKPASNKPSASLQPQTSLTLSFEPPHWLVLHGAHLPGREIRINYLEAYCRAGSTDADWVQHTVIPHSVQFLSLSGDRKLLRLRDTLVDGVTVEHHISARDDQVDFRLEAHNPGAKPSEAHWAQACVRLADFTGFNPQGSDIDDYLPKCFIFLNGKLTRLSEVRPWAKQARYTPGQVWCPKSVPRTDVNPRPLSSLVPDNGLIGAFSADEKLLFATVWEPYQELFQGVIRCLHSDFRLGGLQPGETKHVRGAIYLLTNNVPALLSRYAQDFPEHQAAAPPVSHGTSSGSFPSHESGATTR